MLMSLHRRRWLWMLAALQVVALQPGKAWADRYSEGTGELAAWYRTGQLVAREDVVTGSVDSFPDVLLKLFAGENTGKLVLQLTR